MTPAEDQSRSRGAFITFEGGEGVGKSTQVKRLSAFLSEKGIPTLLTREPGGTEGANAIRELVVTGAGDRWSASAEALLMYAARIDHVEKVIKPALARGEWVICDRFSDSTLAYQGYGKALGPEFIRRLDRLTLDGFRPDLTLLLDLPPDVGLTRAAARGGPDRFEKMGLAFHLQLRDAFLDIARHARDRIRVVDATGDEDAVAAAIIDAVHDRFGAGRIAPKPMSDVSS